MPSWKKLIASGSDASLNSLIVQNGITGSLIGTSSYSSNSNLLSGQSGSYYLPSSSIDDIVKNNSDIYGSTTKVSQIISLTAAEYASIGTKDSGTLYVII